MGTREYADKRKSLGLCSNCSNKTSGNHTLCGSCLVRVRKNKKRQRALAMEKGLCTRCLVNVPTKGRKQCEICREHVNSWHHRTKDERKDVLDRQKNNRVEKLNRMGLCILCGQNKKVNESHCAECVERRKKYQNNSYSRWKDRIKKSNDNLKREVFGHYGSKCNCPGCGVTEITFLTIDHIEGRKKFGHSRGFGGPSLYRLLKKKGYPKGYQALCFNCNIGKFRNGGTCPRHGHKH